MALPHSIIPRPAQVTARPEQEPFTLGPETRVVAEPASPEMTRIAECFAEMLRAPTGMPVPVATDSGESTLVLRLADAPLGLGDEGYTVEISSREAVITADQPVGVFRGIQTIRQLLPAKIEAEDSVLTSGPWTLPAISISDSPRFAWRGAMLDVVRHFFDVREVKQFIDSLVLYKINVLHLHLTDDQGWRLEIASWPRLAEKGGATQVGARPGGYYTRADYAEIVRYAADRFITLVPEIDMPGHINAALVAYPELAQPGREPEPYTGVRVGFSAMDVDKDVSRRFVAEVLSEVAELTPGQYIHVGGDEVETIDRESYGAFIGVAQEVLERRGKTMIGWEEIAKAKLSGTSIVQHWRNADSIAGLQGKNPVIHSPATKSYLDMKYAPGTELGHDWAGHISVRDAYSWDPAALVPGVTEDQILGIEAPLWTETVRNITAAQYLTFPRLPALAEVGWSPSSAIDWEDFRTRLAQHASRWHSLGINYHRSPEVPWPDPVAAQG